MGVKLVVQDSGIIQVSKDKRLLTIDACAGRLYEDLIEGNQGRATRVIKEVSRNLNGVTMHIIAVRALNIGYGQNIPECTFSYESHIQTVLKQVLKKKVNLPYPSDLFLLNLLGSRLYSHCYHNTPN